MQGARPAVASLPQNTACIEVGRSKGDVVSEVQIPSRRERESKREAVPIVKGVAVYTLSGSLVAQDGIWAFQMGIPGRQWESPGCLDPAGFPSILHSKPAPYDPPVPLVPGMTRRLFVSNP